MTPALGRGPRLFLAGVNLSTAVPGTLVEVPPQDSRHLRDSLRLRIGDHVELGDPDRALIVNATIRTLSPLITLEVGSALPQSTPQRLSMHLIFALCKGDKNELVCDWATELGCSSITFWQAERSIVRLRNISDVATKRERFNKISWGAAEQSRQLRPPEVQIASSLKEVLDPLSSKTALKIWCSLSTDARPLHSYFSSDVSLSNSTDRAPRQVHLLVGPEGDLSPTEDSLLRDHGFAPVSLGARVLRSELAAITAIVSLQAQFNP